MQHPLREGAKLVPIYKSDFLLPFSFVVFLLLFLDGITMVVFLKEAKPFFKHSLPFSLSLFFARCPSTGQSRAHKWVAFLANGSGGAFHVRRQSLRQQRAPQALPVGLCELHVLRADVHPCRVLPRVLLARRGHGLEADHHSEVLHRSTPYRSVKYMSMEFFRCEGSTRITQNDFFLQKIRCSNTLFVQVCGCEIQLVFNRVVSA